MKRTLHGLAVCFGVAWSAQGQVLFNGSYTQGFDVLGNSGSSLVWTDNGTLPGWYATRVTYNASAGTGTGGGLYSFGAGGGSDRALGTLASGSVSPVQFGVRLINSTGVRIDRLSVSYAGEQWRVGGATSVNNRLGFGYLVGGSGLGNSGFVEVSGLGFDSMVDAAASGGAMDGNQAGNRVEVSAEISGLGWETGTELWLRWSDLDDTGSDHALAVDGLSLSAVPEPAEISLATALLLLGWRWVKRRPTVAG